jgi:hypothetical protein
VVQGKDYDILVAMLGTYDIPDSVVREHRIRATMLHKAGGGFSLGYAGLIDVIRFCGIEPGATREKEPVQWTALPSGTRVRIAIPEGPPLEGTYTGTVSPGIVGVRVDGCVHVNEFPTRSLEVIKQFGPSEEESERDAAVALDDPKTPQQAEIDRQAQEVIAAAKRWVAVDPGTAVVVAAGDETIDAEFVAVDFNRPGCLTIRRHGKTSTVPVEDVVLASDLVEAGVE